MIFSFSFLFFFTSLLFVHGWRDGTLFRLISTHYLCGRFAFFFARDVPFKNLHVSENKKFSFYQFNKKHGESSFRCTWYCTFDGFYCPTLHYTCMIIVDDIMSSFADFQSHSFLFAYP